MSVICFQEIQEQLIRAHIIRALIPSLLESTSTAVETSSPSSGSYKITLATMVTTLALPTLVVILPLGATLILPDTRLGISSDVWEIKWTYRSLRLIRLLFKVRMMEFKQRQPAFKQFFFKFPAFVECGDVLQPIHLISLTSCSNVPQIKAIFALF